MPSIDQKSSWVDVMEDDDEGIESNRQVEIDGNVKTTTELGVNEDGEKVKIIRQYRLEKRKVSKDAARRRTLPKFGLSAQDESGPSSQTTIVAEEVKMEFLIQREDESSDQNPSILKNAGAQVIHCRFCGLNHWSLHCPYKNQINKLGPTEEAKGDDKTKGKLFGAIGKDGKRLDSLPNRGKDENNTIRITNLPEETQDGDIRDLFKDFGRITRIFLAKDKNTGNSKGFAFVSFESREAASRAIKGVNGHGYNNLILSVEWARPSN